MGKVNVDALYISLRKEQLDGCASMVNATNSTTAPDAVEGLTVTILVTSVPAGEAIGGGGAGVLSIMVRDHDAYSIVKRE